MDDRELKQDGQSAPAKAEGAPDPAPVPAQPYRLAALLLVPVLGAKAALDVMLILVAKARNGMDPPSSCEHVEQPTDPFMPIWLLSHLTGLIALGLLVWFMLVLQRQLRQLNREPRWSGSWVAVGLLVPGPNFVMPLLLVLDIWRQSAPRVSNERPSQPEPQSQPPGVSSSAKLFIGLWFATCLAAFAAKVFCWSMLQGPVEDFSQSELAYFNLAQGLAAAAALFTGALAIAMIRR